eukprot:746988-Hanusia_phi.AAC.1
MKVNREAKIAQMIEPLRTRQPDNITTLLLSDCQRCHDDSFYYIVEGVRDSLKEFLLPVL